MKALDAVWSIYIADANGYCVCTQYRGSNSVDYSQAIKKASGMLAEEAALDMAKQGKTYKQILEYYYSNSDAANYTSITYQTLHDHYYVTENTYKRCKYCNKLIISALA